MKDVLLYLAGTAPKVAIVVAVFARCECIPHPHRDAGGELDAGQDAGAAWCFQPGHASGHGGFSNPCFASEQECVDARAVDPLASGCWEQAP